MIPHIETTIIYNYFVENWENAIVPTKNILRTISDDANDFFEKTKEEHAQIPLHSYSYG